MKRAAWVDIGVGLVYLLLTVGMLWPLPAVLGRAVPGDIFDIWHNVWAIWWVKRCLVGGRGSLFYTDLLFFPRGTSLLFHTLSLSNTILALPVTVLWGPVAAYGFLALLSFVASGMGGYYLALEVLSGWGDLSPASRRGAAFVGGTAIAFSTYHLAHLRAHLNLIAYHWLLFYLWAMLRLRRAEGRAWKQILVAAGLLALTGWSEWLYALFAVGMTGGYLLFALWQQPRAVWGRAVRLLGAVAAGLAVLGVQWVPMLHEQARNPAVHPSPAYAIHLSADLLAYLTPPPGHPLWGQWAALLSARYNPTEGLLYLGVIPLALAATGLRRRWQGRGFWLATALGGFVLSLGPVLHVAGRIVTWRGSRILLPYGVLYLLPLMDILRTPARFGLLVVLAVGLFAAVGMASLLRRPFLREGQRWLLAGLCALLVCGEQAWLPFPVEPAEVPAFYRDLAEVGDGRAVLEVPIARYPADYTERMFYQTVHGHPIYGGFVARGDPHLPYERIPGFRLFRALGPVREITDGDAAGLRAQALAALNHYRAGYVVLQRTALTPAQEESARRLAEVLFGKENRIHEDEEVVAYRVPPAGGVFWELGEGWGVGLPQPAFRAMRAFRGEAELFLEVEAPTAGRVCVEGQGPWSMLSLVVDGTVRSGERTGEERFCSERMVLGAGRHRVVLRGSAGATYRVWSVRWEP
ncbi:MAG: hypothetical protein ACP5SI_05840 [Chloroflexia bacterium]